MRRKGDFNPRSPQGGATCTISRRRLTRLKFQSTLPARGSDHIPWNKDHRATIGFQSTLPARGSDEYGRHVMFLSGRFQSTLPARGSDWQGLSARSAQGHFNPRSPQGGATSLVLADACSNLYFNPRSPQGGATAEKCICMQHFREFAEYYPLRHGDARCIAPQDCIIQAFFGAKKRCFYVRLCFALKNKGVRG